MEQWSSQGATIGWVAVNERPLGIFGVADSLRPEAVEAVSDLKVNSLPIVARVVQRFNASTELY